jgi:hypothetical protein
MQCTQDQLITTVLLRNNCSLQFCNDGGHVAHYIMNISFGDVDVVTKATGLKWNLL